CEPEFALFLSLSVGGPHSGEAVTSAYGAELVVFGSSRANELSLDGAAGGNSLFTRHFLAGLNGKADYNKEHAITFQEAARYAASRLNDFNKGRTAKDQQRSMWPLPQGTPATLFISKMRQRTASNVAKARPGSVLRPRPLRLSSFWSGRLSSRRGGQKSSTH